MELARGGAEFDQVVRRCKFEKEHPEVTVMPLGSAGPWQAVLPVMGGSTVITRYDLADVLDAAEDHFAMQDEPATGDEPVPRSPS